MRRSSVLFALFLISCGVRGESREGETIGRVAQPILAGTPSDDSQDAVVLLAIQNPEPGVPLGICTAALIAPRLVLTARHCVSHANQNVACLSDGTPSGGGQISGNHEATSLFVFTGKNRPDLDPTRWKPAGAAIEIVDDSSGNLCNHDLALVVLKDPIVNVPVAAIRLDDGVAAGEGLLTVGWGVATTEAEPKQRQQRGGVTVKRVGPNDGYPTLTKNEILFDESICLGDSGGPIFSADTGAVIAVVSRGSNGADPSKGGAGATCTEADNLGTRIAPFKDIVMKGFERAGAQPTLEQKKDDDDCSFSPHGLGRARAGSPLFKEGLVALGLVLGLVWRRRRPRS